MLRDAEPSERWAEPPRWRSAVHDPSNPVRMLAINRAPLHLSLRLSGTTSLPQSPSSMQRRVPTGQYPYTKGMQGMHMHAAAEPVRRTTSDDDEYDACGDAQEYDEFAAREDKAPSPEQDDTYMTHDPARMPSPARTLTYANPSYKPPQQHQQLQLPAMFHTAAEVANGEECTQPKSTPVRATDPFARAWGECSCMHARLGFHARTGAACVWCTTGAGRLRDRCEPDAPGNALRRRACHPPVRRTLICMRCVPPRAARALPLSERAIVGLCAAGQDAPYGVRDHERRRATAHGRRNGRLFAAGASCVPGRRMHE